MPVDVTHLLEIYLARKVLDAAVKAAGHCLAGVKSKLLSTPDTIAAALERHLREVRNWASEVTFGDLKEAKQTNRIFVQLDCYVVPRHRRISLDEPVTKVPLDTLFATDAKHFVFLGTPGAGKTTSMKSLCNKIFTDENFAPDRVNYPVLIKLRDLNHSDQSGRVVLLNALCDALGLTFEFAEALQGRSQDAMRLRFEAVADVVCKLLNETKALLILDGFDEIAEFELREAVLQQIRTLALRLDTATLALTSRTGEFMAVIDTARIFEICALGPEQIADFAKKWIGDDKKAGSFLKQVAQSPFADSAIKPLTLAHLCAVFERVGSIPEKPKTVYRKILHLLLEDWDEQRSVTRKSRYSSFESDRKYEFLANLAFHLTVDCRSVVFSSRDIAAIYRKMCQDFGLPKDEAADVAKELESHTGLFVQCGFSEFEFAHKSLQEFLAAEFLVRLPSIPHDNQVLEKLPNEFAIATTISSNPSLYLSELVLRRFTQLTMQESFLPTYVTRLLQERPDFKSEQTVVFALLALYSMTVKGHGRDMRQMQLFLYDKLVSEFEDLLSSILRTNSMASLERHYAKVGQATVVSSSPVHTFRKTKDLRDFALPEELLIRESFLKRLASPGEANPF